MINVTDLNGNNIEVYDLNEAIVITEDRKDYRHVNESYEDFDKKQSIYWKDLYQKLITIRDQQYNKET